MQFKINGNIWFINEISKTEMEEKFEEDALGYTNYGEQVIYLLNYQANILRTLRHELTHAWLWEYGHYQHEKEFTNEDVCEIVACISDFINEVIERYKREEKLDEF